MKAISIDPMTLKSTATRFIYLLRSLEVNDFEK